MGGCGFVYVPAKLRIRILLLKGCTKIWTTKYYPLCSNICCNNLYGRWGNFVCGVTPLATSVAARSKRPNFVHKDFALSVPICEIWATSCSLACTRSTRIQSYPAPKIKAELPRIPYYYQCHFNFDNHLQSTVLATLKSIWYVPTCALTLQNGDCFSEPCSLGLSIQLIIIIIMVCCHHVSLKLREKGHSN
jgi:hypothetical protein